MVEVRGPIGALQDDLAQMLDRPQEHPALISLRREGQVLSSREINRRSLALAAGMLRLGLRPGDAVAIWLPNRPEWMVLHFAAARAGLLTIPINTWCKDSEVSHLLRLGQCKAILFDPSFRGIDFGNTLQAALKALDGVGDNPLKWIIDVAGGGPSTGNYGAVSWVGLDKIEEDAKDHPMPDGRDNTSMIAFSTSGTTSLPKLAVHRGDCLMAHAKAVAARARMTREDVVLAALPPCGAYGYGLIMAALASGAPAIQCEAFDLDEVVEIIRTRKVTMLALTEPLIRQLLDHPRASRENFQSLRIVFSAGATLKSVVERAEQQFGFRISNVYGSSEVLALAAFWDFTSDVATRSAAGGRLVSDGMKVRAVNDAGDVLPVGVTGELQFSGPVIMREYLANAKATKAAFSADGWFSSQDFGCILDEAGTSFHYISRLNDAIRLKGFLVNPGEIEDMLQKHPRVLAAQVVGIPDGKGEDLAAAFVILDEGAAAVSGDELRAFCKAHMASYKIPTLLEVLENFPTTRSANGDKVVKHRLREIAKDILSHG